MGVTAAKFCQWTRDTYACIRFHELGVVELTYRCDRMKKHCV